jgi:AraC-like DNA-binding protein
MIAITGLDDFLASPGARYLAGPLSLSFIVDPGLVGVSTWGRPSAEQIMDLVRAHERMRPVLAPRTAALVDVRHLEWPDPSAFAAVVGYVAERRDWLAEYIERLALVRAELGPVGAASAGFFDVTERPFAVETFTDLRGALAWIGRADAAALDVELEAILVEASGTPAMLRRLRARLDASPGGLALPAAARALGVTERSLQRRLKSWSTTFQAEQNRAQVRVAQRLLRERDAPLAEIASEVGCASLSHFSALFRRITGEAPSDWRKRHAPR